MNTNLFAESVSDKLKLLLNRNNGGCPSVKLGSGPTLSCIVHHVTTEDHIPWLYHSGAIIIRKHKNCDYGGVHIIAIIDDKFYLSWCGVWIVSSIDVPGGQASHTIPVHELAVSTYLVVSNTLE